MTNPETLLDPATAMGISVGLTLLFMWIRKVQTRRGPVMNTLPQGEHGVYSTFTAKCPECGATEQPHTCRKTSDSETGENREAVENERWRVLREIRRAIDRIKTTQQGSRTYSTEDRSAADFQKDVLSALDVIESSTTGSEQ